jgi:pimeloyl-ACP methyl ester carboxylesterase
MRLHSGRPAALPTLLLATGLALSGCTSFSSSLAGAGSSAPAATTAAAPAPAPIAWSDCNSQIQPLIASQPGSNRNLTFQCGRVKVPISYAEPRGATLPLFLVKAVLAGQAGRLGSLVVNPGGPGTSGADAAISLALTLPQDVLQRFDVVGFDPRGVSQSTPVKCIPDTLKEEVIGAEPQPVTTVQLQDRFALAHRVADSCAKQYGDVLGTFNTVDTARDMDRLRQSLGDQKLNYLGYSYGTTLGATYAQLFPKNVRAMVLDGAVDPDADPQTAAENQAQALETGFDTFATNCTGLIAGCPIGHGPRQFVVDLLAQAEKAPIATSTAGDTRKASAGVVMTAIKAGISESGTWPQLAQALSAARRGDAKGVFALADSAAGRLTGGTYSNRLDAMTAVTCADTTTTFTEAQITTTVAAWNAKYPLFGAGEAADLYGCSVWKAHRTPVPKPVAAGSPPILVVGNTGDPVTPMVGAQNLAADLTSGVLLVWQGQGHTSYPRNSCVIASVNDYLINLKPPLDGLTCPK